jgi:hypothetical protein
MLEAETVGGKRKMPGSRKTPKTRGFRIWPKFPVDRSDAENPEPTCQNQQAAKRKRRETK